jgi:flagellar motor switch protein FliN/FliY
VSDREADLDRVLDVPIQVRVELGRRSMSIGDLLDLSPGQIVPFDRLADGLMDVYAVDVIVAHGQVVVIDEEFGVRVTELLADLPVDAQVEVPVWGGAAQ